MTNTPPSPVDRSRPVLVTGANGFIASWIVAQLLDEAWRVRGTVRDPAKAGHLRALSHAAERLELVSADLLDADSLRRAAEGCSAMLHTASPYALNVADPQRDLIDPAVQGTVHALHAATAAGISRVVVTSSVAAITDQPRSDHVYTEADWNRRSTVRRNPYYYSKVLAERATWDHARAHPGLSVAVINPFMVIGPAIDQKINTSNQAILDLMNGTYPAIMDLDLALVDVRDVAAAHVRALERPAFSGRCLVCAEVWSMRRVVEWLRANDFDPLGRLPRRGLDHRVGTWIAWLAAQCQPSGVRTYLRTHLGRRMRLDQGVSVRELGLTYRPVAETLRDTATGLRPFLATSGA